MKEKIVTTTIEILGKLYPVRCPETEVKSLQEAATFLNDKMSEVQESGKAINLERIAIISALNIAHAFLNLDQENESLVKKINHKLTSLQDRLDAAANRSLQTDLMYASGDTP